MQPGLPRISAHGGAGDPWRLIRLARTDGRVRELMRMLTREPEAEAASLGEVIWVRHVLRLHDDRGSLVASVSHELAGSPWLGLVTAVLRRAWEGEDEDDVLILFPDGTSRRAADLLPEEPILRAPSLGLASRDVIMGDET